VLSPITAGRATIASSRQMMPWVAQRRLVTSGCHVARGQWLGTVLSGHLTYTTMLASG
jgi:hypothetical protein